jgi:ATP-binding cassette subfamily C protein LapB
LKKEHWVDAILLAAKYLERMASPEAIRQAAIWLPSARSPEVAQERILSLVSLAGLEGTFTRMAPAKVPRALWPFLVELDGDGGVLLVTEVTSEEVIGSMRAGDATTAVRLPLEGEMSAPHALMLLQPAARRVDERVSDYAPRANEESHWLRAVFAKNRRLFFELGAGSLVGNVLGVATAIFSMQVWDRVVPARSTNTLWVLALGVAMALLLEYGLRVTRASITDHFGKKADLELSDFFFGRLLDIRNDARPRSPGSLISQMRDFEQVRELLTSTAFGVLLDIPFVLIFIGVIALLGGWLAIVPLVAAPLVVLPGLLAQRALAKLSTAGMAESALRNAILMESVYRVEDIKGLQSEPRFRRLWRQANQRLGDISLRQRHLTSMLVSFSGTTQNMAYAGVIIAGVYGVLNNALSTGTVIACSLLTSRTLAPLAQIPAVLARLQNTKVAKEGLDKMLALPIDHDPHKERYHKPVLAGGYQLENAKFAYGPEEGAAMTIDSLTIKPGERIAILGRTGAGKSTLIRMLAGMAPPQEGRILLDGTQLGQIDMADVRRSVGCLLQDASLFHGTLRENLTLAAPLASQEAVQRALKMVCADRLLLNQQHGMDLPLRESGAGLSGGQKQVLMLARLVLREPRIVLLDEPTASLDEGTEQEVIRNLDTWLEGRTLVVATHRYPILSIVQRVIVVDRGRIVLDAPRDEALAKLAGKDNKPAAAAKPPAAGAAVPAVRARRPAGVTVAANAVPGTDTGEGSKNG